MDYTTSPDFDTVAGKRLHKDSGPIDTVWSAKDANQIIWNLMKLLEDAGVSPASFDGTVPSTYDRVSLAVAARATGLFTGSGNVSLAANGYQRLPSGLILQWASQAYADVENSGSSGTLTLPIAFPTACRQAFATLRVTAGDPHNVWVAVTAMTTTAITYSLQEASSSVNPGTVAFLAIGH